MTARAVLVAHFGSLFVQRPPRTDQILPPATRLIQEAATRVAVAGKRVHDQHRVVARFVQHAPGLVAHLDVVQVCPVHGVETT